jgi:hypothetical protein
MTPAQRQYDLDLAQAMTRMAHWIEPRSRKVSQTLLAGAQRIQALSAEVPVDQPAQQQQIQPASTPVNPNR